MTQPAQREEHGSPGPVPAGLQATQQHAEVHDHEDQADGEGVLPRHRAGQVAADDVARVRAVDVGLGVDQEQQRTADHEHRSREGHAGHPAEEVAGHRQRHRTDDGHELERNAVGQPDPENGHENRRGDQPAPLALRRDQSRPDDDGDGGQDRQHGQAAPQPDVERHDGQRRDDHVEVEQRQPGVPVGAPAGEATAGQEMVSQVGGPENVGAHVAARRCVHGEDQVGAQLDEHERGRDADRGDVYEKPDQTRPRHHGHPLPGPPPEGVVARWLPRRLGP